MPNQIEISLAYNADPAIPAKRLSVTGNAATIHPRTDTINDELTTVQKAGRALSDFGFTAAKLTGPGWTLDSQWALAQGFATAKQLPEVQWADDGNAEQLENMLRAFNWHREVVNAGPDAIYPASLIERAQELLTSVAEDSISFEVVSGDALLEQGWIGIHSVGRASVHEPGLLVADFNPSRSADTKVSACLVGKGITFDSGGYSIKTSQGMVSMKCDMAGAATVTAALALAIANGLNKRVKLFLCCAENMIAGHAYKLGDVLTYKNGTTVEIVNTDAEGRLVLADGLQAAAACDPDSIIDAATLTGAAMVAVGTEYNAVFSLNADRSIHAMHTAKDQHERLWPLPLDPFHQDLAPSAFADTANSRPIKGGGMGGASVAAGFLSRFVGDYSDRWLHFDLAAAYRDKNDSQWSAGATGVGIRTIASLIGEG